MKINLKGLSRKELEKLRADVDKALERVEEDEKRAALVAAQKAAKSFGYSLEDLSDVKAGKPAKAKKAGDGRSKVAPKYRNPDEPTVTWTGRGRKPKWVEAHLANGGKLEDVLI
ncbi:H-NS histone family protein [Maritimibacter sp. UBA3975]|uniref:H-NS histone family protein n=1 Tax=Maritimibacter sp. UBA3975 TaxID=1946833 RepID=UPI000C0B6DF4|nr:H-NS histone family protein [Maritimibacter sp. UBA3975]MAM62758.1 DNA-binding protein [Maritimibacter sp.]|tara:strand:- start:11805 stop:12146 length:342 start_codon:yes stop_codon:yes gene_type:complete